MLRKKHRIKVTSVRAPDPLQSFAELQQQYSLPRRLLQNLPDNGWHVPTPIQRQAVPALLAGQDLFAVAPTGTAHRQFWVQWLDACT